MKKRFTSIEDVLANLKEKTQSLADNSDGLIENETQYECPKCQDRQGRIEQRERGDVWIRCDCVEWRKAQRLMKSSEITDEFKKLGFQNFKTDGKPQIIKDAYACALNYFQSFKDIVEQRQNSIALLGQPGAGKTHLLTAVSNNFIRKLHIPVLYFPFVEGFNDLKDDFDKLEEKLERMKRIDVLFIDDLFKPANGKPRATDWQVEQVYAVINHRYLNYKPIMVSSELDIDQLCDIDEALGTRIYEMCRDYCVVIKGDRRELNHRL